MVPRRHGGSTRTTTVVGRAGCACTGRARCRFLPARQPPSSLFLVSGRSSPNFLPPRHLPRYVLQLPFEFADFMGHLRRLMKELYEAGFCFKECTGLVDNFHITTRLSCLQFPFLDAWGVVDRMLAVIVLVISRGSACGYDTATRTGIEHRGEFSL